MQDMWLFVGLGTAVILVGTEVVAAVRVTRRLKAQSADRIRLKRQVRRVRLGLVGSVVLPLGLLTLVLTGNGVIALFVLIGYVFLGVGFMVLIQTVLLPRARRRAGH